MTGFLQPVGEGLVCPKPLLAVACKRCGGRCVGRVAGRFLLVIGLRNRRPGARLAPTLASSRSADGGPVKRSSSRRRTAAVAWRRRRSCRRSTATCADRETAVAGLAAMVTAASAGGGDGVSGRGRLSRRVPRHGDGTATGRRRVGRGRGGRRGDRLAHRPGAAVFHACSVVGETRRLVHATDSGALRRAAVAKARPWPPIGLSLSWA